ncbi:hypothetical protein MVEN_02605500 [Mycena venus]|uniref:Uncharacterized protein n=1 Tax=Mycena venus TaxID=2733690 RepID=A0A8H6TWG6_9AGAR|nr:hypothetical protein MVEN_02605500 [Mycena venus]
MASLSPPVDDRCPYYATDLQTDAVRLCIALQAELNPAFLGASIELLCWASKLAPAEFRRHSRKIIRLIETARDTLEASGISLYLFTASCQKGKWKDVYFDLLRMLRARRGDIDDALQARTNSLLIRLSSNFLGRDSSVASTNSSARISLPENTRQLLARGITTCTPQPHPSSSTTPCITMPPPDAFLPDAERSFQRPKRPRQPLPFLVTEVTTRPRKRSRLIGERENQVPSAESSSATYVYKSPPLTKRFGIFCTGKGSMHQSRSQAVRAY